MHTPGPWKLFEGEHSEVVEVLDNRGLPIVSWGGFDDSRRTDEEHNANARLIAEAPAMLEALEQVESIIESESFFGHHSLAEEKAMSICAEAIRKAKGD